jgi:hypothetical protein
MLATGMTVILILVLGNAREFSGGFGLGMGLAALGTAAICTWGNFIPWQGEEKGGADAGEGGQSVASSLKFP